MDRVLLNISFLKSFILDVETEKILYNKMMKILVKEAQEIRDRYKGEFEIEKFLQLISKLDTDEKKQLAYDEFSKKQATEKYTYGHIFELLLEDTNDDKIAYALNYKLVNADHFNPTIGKEKYYQIMRALNATGQKVITSTIQSFEDYFSALLYRLIKENPEQYLHGKTIDYATLITSDIEKLKEDLIEKEVEQLMYGVSETIEKVNKNHKFQIEKYQHIWDNFIEMELHRNIIVHNMGIVNKTYLDKLPKSCKIVKEGACLSCDQNCIQFKTNNLIKFAYLLYYLVGNSEFDLDELDKIAFDLLKNENWEVAEFAYDLLLKIKKLENAQKLSYVINKLNAKKHLFGMEKVQNEILQIDVSGMEIMFKVAKNLLLEEYSTILEDLEQCYPHNYDAYALQTWPIFIEFRKTDKYKKFREKHKDTFGQYEYSPKVIVDEGLREVENDQL